MKLKGMKWISHGLIMGLLLGSTACASLGMAQEAEQKEMPLKPRYSSSKDQTLWERVSFGSYPQSEVKDECIIQALEQLPEEEYDQMGNVMYEDVQYRRLSENTALNVGEGDGYYSWDDTENHYFICEPIVWRVLDVDDKGMVLMSDICLDDKKYNNKPAQVQWSDCSLRSWLNGYDASANAGGYNYSGENSFLQQAFSEEERQYLMARTVENPDNDYYGTTGGDEVEDKIYLLSLEDICSTAFGFSRTSDSSGTRLMECSEYAWARGIYREKSAVTGDECCFWWLRSPGMAQDEASGVSSDGECLSGVSQMVDYTENGLVPVIYLSNQAVWGDSTDRLSPSTGSSSESSGSQTGDMGTGETPVAPDTVVTPPVDNGTGEGGQESQGQTGDSPEPEKITCNKKVKGLCYKKISRRKVRLLWNTLENVDGYKIKVKVYTGKKTETVCMHSEVNIMKLSGLNPDYRYRVRVQPYRLDGTTKVCGQYSKTVTIKLKE